MQEPTKQNLLNALWAAFRVARDRADLREMRKLYRACFELVKAEERDLGKGDTAYTLYLLMLYFVQPSKHEDFIFGYAERFEYQR